MDYKAEYEKLRIEYDKLVAENVERKRRLGIVDVSPNSVADIEEKPNVNIEKPNDNFSSAAVTAYSTPQEKIALFMSLFRGRTDVYAKRWNSEKSGKSGYQPVCLNEWNTWLCDKRKVKCAECGF